MEKRIILAPISANKWQEPCLNLAAILDIFFLSNIHLGERWSNVDCFLGLNF